MRRLIREVFPDAYNSGSSYTISSQQIIDKVRNIPQISNIAYSYLAPFIIKEYIRNEVDLPPNMDVIAKRDVLEALTRNECSQIDYTSREVIMTALFGNPNRVKKMKHFDNMDVLSGNLCPLHFPLAFRLYKNLEKMSVFTRNREGFSWSKEHSLTLPRFKELEFTQVDFEADNHDFSKMRGLKTLTVNINHEGVEDQEEYKEKGDVMITVPLGIRHLNLAGTVCLKDDDFSHLEELKTLEISNIECDYISDIPRGLDRCNKFKELSLEGVVGRDDLNLLGILPGLTRLRLIYSSIKELNAALFPNLLELKLEGCDGLAEIDLSLFLKLRSLKVSNCNKLKIKGIAGFIAKDSSEEIGILNCDLLKNGKYKSSDVLSFEEVLAAAKEKSGAK
jgi:hypothetical protein